MITDRDREIVNFIDLIGFATINQIAIIFFTEANYRYDLARKRLRKISKENYIKSLRNSETNELIYIPATSKKKKVSIHDVTAVSYLAELKQLGAEIVQVQLVPQFDNVIPDALICFNHEGYRYWQLLEVEIRHDVVDTKRFLPVMDLILKATNNVIPKLVILQNTNKDYQAENKDLDIVQLKLDLKGIWKVLE